jgi:VanZ family protein
MIRRGLAWAALALYCALIFALSAMSDPPGMRALHMSDKVLHAGAFGVMAALAALAGRVSVRRWSAGASAMFGFAFAVVYGVTDELHQRGTPGRSSDVRDVIADAVGAALVALALRQWWGRGEK